ncbi:serine/threonine protein kinase [Herpetosiphon giganteus]|uniref:serine/threonine protein kinase n=1 Tax=Herpetosiphon giganteus TaxID=2029754 RepID=UPI0019589A0C|nr:serine/threonine-protein kinase [Herpetosiphon giganteus]MBM7843203.1 serine/threonine protein kinase/tetratricopeptide (TPR) repeat protein [Herpetosiphon giganteus]
MKSFEHTQLGEYTLQEEIGRGGMAQVYRAQHQAYGQVAFKVLPPYFAHDNDTLQRFMREARANRTLHHPHIVQLYEASDIAQAQNPYQPIHYIAMEYIAGGTLTDRLRQQPQQPLNLTLEMGEQIGSALDYAHGKGFIHRDIKPSNILFRSNGHAVLADFGIALANNEARMTKAGGFAGTVAYTAPEIFEGETADMRSDIYALGLILYESLAGHNPYANISTNAQIAMSKILTTPLPPLQDVAPHVPPLTAEILAQATAKDPIRRFATMSDFVEALKQAKFNRVSDRPAQQLNASGRPMIPITNRPGAPNRPPQRNPQAGNNQNQAFGAGVAASAAASALPDAGEGTMIYTPPAANPVVNQQPAAPVEATQIYTPAQPNPVVNQQPAAPVEATQIYTPAQPNPVVNQQPAAPVAQPPVDATQIYTPAQPNPVVNQQSTAAQTPLRQAPTTKPDQEIPRAPSQANQPVPAAPTVPLDDQSTMMYTPHSVPNRPIPSQTNQPVDNESTVMYPAYPVTGNQAYPQTGNQAYPQTGNQAYPQTGNQAYPQTGNQAYPQTGNQAYPQTGNQAYPQTGNQAYPAMGGASLSNEPMPKKGPARPINAQRIELARPAAAPVAQSFEADYADAPPPYAMPPKASAVGKAKDFFRSPKVLVALGSALLALLVIAFLSFGRGKDDPNIASVVTATSDASVAGGDVTPTATTTTTAAATPTAEQTSDPQEAKRLEYVVGQEAYAQQDWPKAAAAFDKVLAIDPAYLDLSNIGSATYYNWTINELTGPDKVASGLEILNKTFGFKPDHQPGTNLAKVLNLYRNGQTAAEQQDWQAAINAYREAQTAGSGEFGDLMGKLQTVKQLYEAYLGRGRQLEEAGNIEGANAIYREAAGLQELDGNLDVATANSRIRATAPTEVPATPTRPAPPTAVPVAQRLYFQKYAENAVDPTCFAVHIRGVGTNGWFVAVDGLGNRGNVDGAGNTNVCGLAASQEVTFTVYNAQGSAVPGGGGIPTRGGDLMTGYWQ